MLAIKIDCFAPVRLVICSEVTFGELPQVIAVGADVVVDHIQQDGDSATMRRIDECTEIIRSPVNACGCEQVYAVVSPAEGSGKLRYGHHLNRADPQLRQYR